MQFFTVEDDSMLKTAQKPLYFKFLMFSSQKSVEFVVSVVIIFYRMFTCLLLSVLIKTSWLTKKPKTFSSISVGVGGYQS